MIFSVLVQAKLGRSEHIQVGVILIWRWKITWSLTCPDSVGQGHGEDRTLCRLGKWDNMFPSLEILEALLFLFLQQQFSCFSKIIGQGQRLGPTVPKVGLGCPEVSHENQHLPCWTNQI